MRLRRAKEVRYAHGGNLITPFQNTDPRRPCSALRTLSGASMDRDRRV